MLIKDEKEERKKEGRKKEASKFKQMRIYFHIHGMLSPLLTNNFYIAIPGQIILLQCIYMCACI